VPCGYDCLYTFEDGSTLISRRALSGKELAAQGRAIGKQLIENSAEQNII
jgi:hypothetical protein